MEAPLYSKIALLARQMDLLLLGTFHDRQGDQSLIDGNSGTWGRLIAVGLNQSFTGPLSPSFSGTIAGAQMGSDLFTTEDHRDRIGLFTTYAHANGTVRGDVLDVQKALAGTIPTDAYTLGGYATHLGDNGWYLDAVLMGSWFKSYPRSDRGIGINVTGTGFNASLEGGYPFRLDDEFILEPTAQIVYSSIGFEPSADLYSTLDFDPADAWFGRIGARLEDNVTFNGIPAKPFLELNLWHSFGGTDVTLYNSTIPVAVPFGNTDLELATGGTAQMGDGIGLYARVSYLFDVSGNDQQAVQGNVGIRYSW
jgi:autotransporter family porin